MSSSGREIGRDDRGFTGALQICGFVAGIVQLGGGQFAREGRVEGAERGAVDEDHSTDGDPEPVRPPVQCHFRGILVVMPAMPSNFFQLWAGDF